MTDYKLTERLRDGRYAIVSRGVRESDGRPVIIKQLRELYPLPSRVAELQRELDLTNLAASDGVIAAYEIEQYEGAVRLIVEDFGGSSLAYQMLQDRLTLAEFLAI